MLKLVSIYTLCAAGGYGSATVLREGIEEKKPLKIILGAIVTVLSFIGAIFAGEHANDDLFDDGKVE